MSKYVAGKFADELIMAARVLLMLLFLLFGWQKITSYTHTAALMAQLGAPLPTVSAAIAIVMELFVGIAILVGFLVRPLAILLLAYTLGTAIIGHHYWNMSGEARFENMINFYKNVAICRGLLLLWVTGAGRYALDKR